LCESPTHPSPTVHLAPTPSALQSGSLHGEILVLC
jgi:hypothetical protein